MKVPEKEASAESVTKCRAGASCPGLHIGGSSLISGRLRFARVLGLREISARLTEGLVARLIRHVLFRRILHGIGGRTTCGKSELFGLRQG